MNCPLCISEKVPVQTLCESCSELWRDSPEFQRVKDTLTFSSLWSDEGNARYGTALVDFVTRMRLERENGQPNVRP